MTVENKNDRSILITGGTGFLGRALAARLLELGFERVCIFSRSEHLQAQMFHELGGHPALRMFIGDVRDRARLWWAMRSVDYVIHAAALKRIEVGYYNPTEMIKTNIDGSMNVVEAAIQTNVKRVVLVSSDKAYAPASPYGQSKAMAESLFLAANNVTGTRGSMFGVCRYGNVAGSTGSVIPTWRERKKQGQPCTITDPSCTRFWMTRDQAVDLVLASIDNGRDVNIPHLPAFALGDLAKAMDVECTVTGLAGWEKKHETLQEGQTSDTAPRMTVEDLRRELVHV